MNFFYPYCKKYTKYLIIAVVTITLSVIAEMLQPTLMSNIVDIGIANLNFKYIITYGLIMIFLSLIAICLGIGNIYSSAIVSQGLASELRKDIFTYIQNFSFANINKFSTSSLITRITNDINTLQMTFLMILRMLLRAPITLIFTFVMITIIDSQLALIVLAVIPIFILIIYFVAVFAMPRFLKMQSMIDKMNITVQEELTNIRLVKSFVREDFEQEKFNKVADELMNKTINAFNIAIAVMPVMILLLNITTITVWWFGGTKFITGNIEIGKLVAFITYIFNILFSIMMLSFVFLLIVRSKASLQRVKEVLNEKIDIVNTKNPINNKINIESLEFKNVSFKYTNKAEEFALKNVNFKAVRGQIIAIIGSTSSSKSTLVQLIPRFFNVTEGKILINGININDYDLETLRNSIGFVMQKNILFSGTIEENIKWGKPNASEEEIINACKSAQAHDFIISLPDKYKTQLGQMGINVSGGQKQRLCIARAIIKQPEILILDDSTSAVDSTTEAKIYESFHNDLKDTIKIIIAQRISSVKDADKIIVLENGEIAAIGTHNELMESNEIYKLIYQSQNRSIKSN